MIKNFNQFVNENREHHTGAFGEILDPNLRRDDLYDLMTTDYEAFEKECNEIVAQVIDCDPSEIYFIGSPVNEEDVENDPNWTKVKDLLVKHNGSWMLDPSQPGDLLWWCSVPAPDGYMAAYLFHHKGSDIVMYDADDGPYIYIRA